MFLKSQQIKKQGCINRNFWPKL